MKEKLKPEELVELINFALAGSEGADGDCKTCKVKSLTRVTTEELNVQSFNWAVRMVNSDCRGDCRVVLEQIVQTVGKNYDAVWI